MVEWQDFSHRSPLTVRSLSYNNKVKAIAPEVKEEASKVPGEPALCL